LLGRNQAEDGAVHARNPPCRGSPFGEERATEPAIRASAIGSYRNQDRAGARDVPSSGRETGQSRHSQKDTGQELRRSQLDRSAFGASMLSKTPCEGSAGKCEVAHLHARLRGGGRRSGCSIKPGDDSQRKAPVHPSAERPWKKSHGPRAASPPPHRRREETCTLAADSWLCLLSWAASRSRGRSMACCRRAFRSGPTRRASAASLRGEPTRRASGADHREGGGNPS
jgi:hypothetical protein